jgi:hypothetical protein
MTTLTIKIKRTTEIAGSCLQGYVYATRAELIKIFGTPGNGDDGYKVFHNWGVFIQVQPEVLGTTANIYDWKYDEVFPADKVIKWNIGGYSQNAVDAVRLALAGHRGALNAATVEAWYAR